MTTRRVDLKKDVGLYLVVTPDDEKFTIMSVADKEGKCLISGGKWTQFDDVVARIQSHNMNVVGVIEDWVCQDYELVILHHAAGGPVTIAGKVLAIYQLDDLRQGQIDNLMHAQAPV